MPRRPRLPPFIFIYSSSIIIQKSLDPVQFLTLFLNARPPIEHRERAVPGRARLARRFLKGSRRRVVRPHALHGPLLPGHGVRGDLHGSVPASPDGPRLAVVPLEVALVAPKTHQACPRYGEILLDGLAAVVQK